MKVLRTSLPIVLVLVVLFSVLARLVIASICISSHPERAITRDSVAYVNSAMVLRTERRFGVSPEFTDVPQTILVPGFPLFLMLGNAVTAERASWVAAAQTLVSALSIIVVFFIGSKVHSQATGFAASGFLALDPNSFGISLFVLSETLFTLFLVGSVFLVILSRQHKSGLGWLISAGVVLGAATLTRAIAQYLGLLILAWIVVDAVRTNRQVRLAMLRGATFILGFTVIVGGWSVRNFVVSGSWNLSQIEGINLLFFRAADVIASVEGISLNEARTRLADGENYQELRHAATLNPQLHLGDKWRKRAVSIILDHPAVYSRRALRGAFLMMIGPADGWLAKILYASENASGPLGDIRRLPMSVWVEKWLFVRAGEGLVFLYSLLYLICLYLFVATSAVMIRRDRVCTPLVFLMGLIIMYLIVVSAGPEAYYRFRVPMAPFLCVLAGIGCTGIIGRMTKSKQANVISELKSSVAKESH